MDFEISAVFMYLNLLMLALVVFVFPDLGYTSRIVGGFAGQALILAFVPTSYFFHMSQIWNYFIVLGMPRFLCVLFIICSFYVVYTYIIGVCLLCGVFLQHRQV